MAWLALPAGQARGGQRRVDAGQVAGVRHDDDHAAAGGGRGGGGDGDLGRPVRAGQGRPGGPDRAAFGQRGQERLPGRVPGPGAGAGPGRHGVRRGGEGLRRSARGLRRGGGFAFGGGVPGRDGQPEHVGQRARVAVGHRPGQVEDLGREHGFRGDHPLQPGQSALVLAGLGPVQQVAVDQLARRTGPGPGSRARPSRPCWPGPGSRRAGPGGRARCRPPPGRPAAAR